MSFKYQRKSIRFATGRGLKATTTSGPISILGPAISGTSLTDISGIESLSGTNAAACTTFTGLLTAATWEAGAVTETTKMWNVLSRCVQCLTDNRLATQP